MKRSDESMVVSLEEVKTGIQRRDSVCNGLGNHLSENLKQGEAYTERGIVKVTTDYLASQRLTLGDKIRDVQLAKSLIEELVQRGYLKIRATLGCKYYTSE